jgi:hypothetical protein
MTAATIVKRDGDLWVQIKLADVSDENGQPLKKPTIGQLATLFQLHPNVVLNSLVADGTALKFLFTTYVNKTFPKSQKEAQRLLFAASTTTSKTATGAKVARPFYAWTLDPAAVPVILLPRNGTTLLAVQQQESIRLRVAKVRDGPAKALEAALKQIETGIADLDVAALALHTKLGTSYKRVRKNEKEPEKNVVEPGSGFDALSPLMDLDRIDVVLNMMAKAAGNDSSKKETLEKIKRLKRLPGEPERAGRLFDDFKALARRHYLTEPFYATAENMVFKQAAHFLLSYLAVNDLLNALEQLARVTFNLKDKTTVTGFLVKETKDDFTVAKSVTDGTETVVKRKDVVEQLGPDWDLIDFALQDRLEDTLRLAYQGLLASSLDQTIVETHVLPLIQKLARMQVTLDATVKNQALADALKNPPEYPKERNPLTILVHLFGFTRSGPGPTTLAISVLQYSAPYLARWATEHAQNGGGGPSKMAGWLMKGMTRVLGLGKKQQQAIVDSVEKQDLKPLVDASAEIDAATSYQLFIDGIMKNAPRMDDFSPAVWIPDTRFSSETGFQKMKADTLRGSGYHGNDMTPDEVVAAGGLPEKGENWYLLEHAIPQKATIKHGGESAMRGSTGIVSNAEGLPSGAAYWGDWVFEFDGMPVWSVNKALQGRVRADDGVHWDNNPYHGEAENAVPARIPIERIKRWGRVKVEVREMKEYKSVPEWTSNPQYKPLPDQLPPLKAPNSVEPPVVAAPPKAGAPPPIADRWYLRAMNHWSFQGVSGILCVIALVGAIEETGEDPLVHWSKILASGSGALVSLGSAIKSIALMSKTGTVPTGLVVTGVSKLATSLALVGAIAGIVVSYAQFRDARENRDTTGSVIAGIGLASSIATAGGLALTLLVAAGWMGAAGGATAWAGGAGAVLIVIGIVLAVVALLVGLVSWLFGSKKHAVEKVLLDDGGLMDRFKSHPLYKLSKAFELGLDDKWGDLKDALKDLDYWDLDFSDHKTLWLWGFDTQTIDALIGLGDAWGDGEYIWACLYQDPENAEMLDERWDDPGRVEQMGYWYARANGRLGGIACDLVKDNPNLPEHQRH